MFTRNIKSLWKNRELIREMSFRDVKGLSKGAVLGIVWIVLSPFIQTVAYVVIVSCVFKARLNQDAGPFDYAVYVLSGMIPWQVVTRSISEAPMLFRSNTELLKQVIYPIETLPLTRMFVNSFGSIVSFVVLFVFMVCTGSLHWTLVLLPVPVFFLLLFILGISWIFSVAGVILKDLKEIVTVFMALIVYISPVIVSREMTGETMWRIIMLNPLAHIVVAFRDVFWAEFHQASWVIFISTSVVLFLAGNWVILKARAFINEYI